MQTKEINGSLFLIDENSEIKIGDCRLYSTIEDAKNKNSLPILCKIKGIKNTLDGIVYIGSTGLSTLYPSKLLNKVIAQQFIDGKTDYIVDTLFEIESTSIDEEREVKFVIEEKCCGILEGSIKNEDLLEICNFCSCRNNLQSKTHTKEINGKEYKCLTIKYK